MKRLDSCKRIVLYICLLLLVCVGCFGQLARSDDWMDVPEAATAMFRQNEIHAAPLDFLCDGQCLSSEDAVSHMSFQERKLLHFQKEALFLSGNQLLFGLAALGAVLHEGLFHDSSCQTLGLRRMIAFILDADGTKERFSFFYIG